MSAKNWSLQNNRKFQELKSDYSAMSAQIWGGAFWDLRQKLGREVADQLLYQAWFALESADVMSNDAKRFVKKLLEADQHQEGGKHANEIKETFKDRGLEL